MPVYIAETGPLGEIVWVWRKVSGARAAKPIQRPIQNIPHVDSACFYGAPAGEIVKWLHGRAAEKKPVQSKMASV